MKIPRIALAVAFLAIVPPVAAQDRTAADIAVTDAWARASAGMAKTGAVFVTLTNTGATPDRLVGASSPGAGTAELHTTIADGNVMRMRPVEAIEVGVAATVELKPGGMHIMLLDLKVPLRNGDEIPVTLTFEKGGPRTVRATVRSAGDMGPHPSR